jgi:hypothetical protein
MALAVSVSVDECPPYGYEVIYVMEHIPTGKKYIGRTSKSAKQRAEQHLSALRGQRHHVRDMQDDYDKYGGNYSVTVLAVEKKRRSHYGCTPSTERTFMRDFKTYIRGVGYNCKDRIAIALRSEVSNV